MIKYCLGIDVSKKEFHCCISVIDQAQKVTVKSSRKCSNNKEGFKELRSWLEKHHKEKNIPLVIVMEATGIYYEQLAYYLFQNKYSVSVVLPNKAKKYLQATGIKSKNDQIDAQGLARMGAEQSLQVWQPLSTFFYELREMTRQHQSLQELKTSINNQLHAAMLGMHQIKLVIKQLKSHISMLETQIEALEKAIEKHLNKDEKVAEKVEQICKIKGLGIQTLAVILAETNGFLLFENSRQLISYAGYDVVENQSGNHRGRTRISKKGNSRIRRAMHLPAFSVVKYKQTPFLNLYERTYERNGQKMKSYVAVQKKLLVIVYALWKNNKDYEINYQHQKHTGEKEQVLPSLLGLEQAGTDNMKIAPPKGQRYTR